MPYTVIHNYGDDFSAVTVSTAQEALAKARELDVAGEHGVRVTQPDGTTIPIRMFEIIAARQVAKTRHK